METDSILGNISETFSESTKLAFTRSKLGYLLLCSIALNVAQGFLRTSSDTNRLLPQDSCANELVSVISALYQKH